jgi:hypothetical protein
MANINSVSKAQSLKSLAEEVVDAHSRAQEILSAHKQALDAYQSFSHGWIEFHAVSKRYRLDELALDENTT